MSTWGIIGNVGWSTQYIGHFSPFSFVQSPSTHTREVWQGLGVQLSTIHPILFHLFIHKFAHLSIFIHPLSSLSSCLLSIPTDFIHPPTHSSSIYLSIQSSIHVSNYTSFHLSIHLLSHPATHHAPSLRSGPWSPSLLSCTDSDLPHSF